jgi:hypothetical protein
LGALSPAADVAEELPGFIPRPPPDRAAWGIPFVALTLGLKTVLAGRYVPDELLELKQSERPDRLHRLARQLHHHGLVLDRLTPPNGSSSPTSTSPYHGPRQALPQQHPINQAMTSDYAGKRG